MDQLKLLKFSFSVIFSLLLISCGDPEGVTPLMMASREGDLELVRALIDSGAGVDEKSDYGYTPLVFACWKGHLDIAQLLIGAGAEVSVQTGEVPSSFETVAGQPPTTALAMAIKNQNAEVAELLTNEGAKIDPVSLAMAGKAGNFFILEQAKNRGISFNTYSGNEFEPSPLCSSIQAGRLDVVRWLFENGAKLDIVLKRSHPLKSAVRFLRPEIVQYLLENGADPNVYVGDPGYHHSFPLGFTVMKSPTSLDSSKKILAIIELLIRHGGNVTFADNKGDLLIDAKRSQVENGRKYWKERPARKTDVLERIRISDEHDESVIRILLNAFEAQSSNSSQ